MIARRLAPLLLLIAVSLPQAGIAQTAPAAPPVSPRIPWEKEVRSIAEGPWNGPRLPDGQPDISGFWSNTIANQSNFTDPQAGDPDRPSAAFRLPRNQRAPSRVTDPADGQVPYQPEARALQEDFARNFQNPTKPQYVEPLARCAPAGVPKSFMWHGHEIRQYPGYVLFLFDSGTRIVHLDDGPHLSDSIKLWNGDSHGHWEGNTLVVNVTNNNGKALFGYSGDFMSENATVVERYIFAEDGKRFNYVATFTDPTVYTRPWTATIPLRRFTEADGPMDWHYMVTPVNLPGKQLLESPERICVENNGVFGGGAVGVPSDRPIISR